MDSERKIEDQEVLRKTKSDECKTSNHTNGGQIINTADKENASPNKEDIQSTVRRHDEPSELSFEICEFVVVI